MTQPFTIEGPDDDGNVWIHTFETVNGERLRMDSVVLGPKDQVAETLSQWLAEIDYGERE